MMNESMSPGSFHEGVTGSFDLHNALSTELYTAERCALAIEHAAIEASPLKEPALDAILELSVMQLKKAIEKAFEIEQLLLRNDVSLGGKCNG